MCIPLADPANKNKMKGGGDLKIVSHRNMRRKQYF